MRDGIYHYLASEVGANDLDPNSIVKVYRDKKEVQKAEMRFKELQRLPFTVNHPLKFLDLNDENSYKQGVSTDPHLGEVKDHVVLKCKVSMNDEATELYKNGIKQLSCGWEGIFKKVENKDYDYVQEFIDFNHIAILPDGRGGSLCSIIDNNFNLKQLMTKEKLSEEITSELKKTVKDAMAEHSEQEKAKEEAEEDKKKEKEEKKEGKEAQDAAIAILVSDAKTALINDYSSVFEAVEKGIVKVTDCKGKAPSEIKQIVVEKLLNKKIDVKDHVILDAHYSVALENYSHPGWAGNKSVKDEGISDAAAQINNINFLEK